MVACPVNSHVASRTIRSFWLDYLWPLSTLFRLEVSITCPKREARIAFMMLVADVYERVEVDHDRQSIKLLFPYCVYWIKYHRPGTRKES